MFDVFLQSRERIVAVWTNTKATRIAATALWHFTDCNLSDLIGVIRTAKISACTLALSFGISFFFFLGEGGELKS